MKKTTLILTLCSLLFWVMPALATSSEQQVPVPGMVTMVDLGAHKCIPCKMMAPILEKLKKEYDGKAAIIFIDVWENRDHGSKFGINAIPTQIFFDKDGKELFRHQGFMAEDDITGQLQKMGVEPPAQSGK